MICEQWNLGEELAAAGYPLRRERSGAGCPYCGNVRQWRYKVKGKYNKCSACGKVCLTHNKR